MAAMKKAFQEMLAAKYGYHGGADCGVANKGAGVLAKLKDDQARYVKQLNQAQIKVVETGGTCNLPLARRRAGIDGDRNDDSVPQRGAGWLHRARNVDRRLPGFSPVCARGTSRRTPASMSCRHPSTAPPTRARLYPGLST